MLKNATHIGLPVIAIGASAGGLEACRALLLDLPQIVRAAFVLILHLDPTHDSMMVDLLASHTGLRVVQAVDGMPLESGALYVIPPRVFLTIEKRTIHLSEPGGGKPVRLPFDILLRSLAKDGAKTSACIVLSGTGTDGSLGLSQMHAAGALIMVQDPREAAYPGMPESAIATGLVSQVLSTGQMGAALVRYLGKSSEASPAEIDAPKVEKADAHQVTKGEKNRFDALLSFMGNHAVQDISSYKRGTLERRIAQRMVMIGFEQSNEKEYLDLLRNDAAECAKLSADLLIHVTSFFRDPTVFEHISSTVVPMLLQQITDDRPLRIWVAGCSTGEEAYSLAMVCTEALEAAGSTIKVQILASDIDPEAVATARSGFFPKEIEATVSSERLGRFFVKDGAGWRVITALRDLIVFTVTDLLSDPPFSKIDLLSCRNVLIYLAPEAQKSVIARCCFALRPGGLLLLGAAEMPGQSDACFALEDKDARLWRRIGISNSADLHFSTEKREDALAVIGQTPKRRSALADLCRKIVLETYSPAAVLLNRQLECQYLLGPTEKYLKMGQGHPDQGIVGMLPKALRPRFRAAAQGCTPANPLATISAGGLVDSATYDIKLQLVSAGSEPLLLACFVDAPMVRSNPLDGKSDINPDKQSIEMAAELEITRSNLANARRDLEHQIETNEADAAEALSVNEEFQSTNEELLASKEELQSLNEELNALNTQLQETLERHRTTANDLQNVLYSTDVATLFLDQELKIRFFTPAAREMFRVISTDVGRPLADLASISKDEELTEDARNVLMSHEQLEREIAGLGELSFMRRIQPYRAEDGRVEGVVITYIDITERKRVNADLVAARSEADRASKAKSRFLASASHDLRQPLQSIALLHKLLSRPKRSTEGTRLAALLDQTLTSMTGMLDSILEVNRIETGIIKPELRPVAITPFLERMVDEFGPLCRQKHLQLRSVPCKAWVQTDPQLLEQILRNLLSNALKYTLKGSILIGCRRRGPLLTVMVYDSGIGIAETEQKVIFDAYHQVDGTSQLASHGLGLGLSIVQRLARLMHHPITVRSTPGKGSAFMITLPVVAQPQETEYPVLIATELAVPVQETGTIILVEDEDPLRDLLAEVLTGEGHTVVALADAQEALTWASGDVERPDLLITDFDLHSGTSGLTLAKDLPLILGQTLPTIILSGDVTTATMSSIAGTPFHQVVKPVMPEVLLALISNLIRKSRTEKAKHVGVPQSPHATVHVIDDDPTIRIAIQRLFEAEGLNVKTYPSAEDFLALPRPANAGCIFVDNVLPGMDGIALISLLQTEKSKLPAIMLTGHGDAAMAVAALKAGALDLIEKPASAAELLAAVNMALKAGLETAPKQQTKEAAQKLFLDLTAREKEVLGRVLAGEPNKIIAADLGINQRTVENHRASVMRKAGVKSLPALVRLALAAS